LTSDGSVYTGIKNVYGLIIGYRDAAAGGRVTLKETDGSGRIRVYGVIDGVSGQTVNGTVVIPCGRWGIEIANCYLDMSDAAVGTMYITVIHS